jgi:2-polyprenyl-3-methyl-5-hydroxy-6-metoxy-1,4-benzoquinol methylase
MSIHSGSKTLEEARSEIDAMGYKYDEMAEMASSEADQGVEDWVREDPVEWRNMNIYLTELERVAHKLGRNILLPGCSDGVVAQVIAEEGYYPVGLALSSKMVEDATERFFAKNLSGEFHVGDITNFDFNQYRGTKFAGVILAHVAPCIPVVGENDDLLRKAIIDSSSLAPEGPYYLSTTYYEDSRYTRKLISGAEVTYYRRPVERYAGILQECGRKILSIEHFNARQAGIEDDYLNDYLIASPTRA